MAPTPTNLAAGMEVVSRSGSALVISSITTGFINTAPNYEGSPAGTMTSGHIRRPTRGISIKQETFAQLYIVDSLTTESQVELRNSSASGGTSSFTANFLVNSVSETRAEKSQPVPTFGHDYIYFFGQQPKIVNFNCTLLNSENFRWEEEWWYNYEHYFRGTKLAAESRMIRLVVDETVIYGYMTNCTASKDSQNPHVVPISFSIHVTDIFSTRPENKIGSSLVADHASTENQYGYIDLGTDTNTALNAIAIGEDSLAVRDYNLKKYANNTDIPGALLRFLGDPSGFLLDKVDDLTGNWAQNLYNFAYGKNIVLPVDAAYADFASGNPQYAEGTANYYKLVEALEKPKQAITVLKVESYSPKKKSNATRFSDNVDEYVNKSQRFTFGPSQKDTQRNAVKDRTEVVADALSKAYGLDKKLLLGNDGTLDVGGGGLTAYGPSNGSLATNVRRAARAATGVGMIALAERSRTARIESQTRDSDGNIKNKYKTPNEWFAIADAGFYSDESNAGASSSISTYSEDALVTIDDSSSNPVDLLSTYRDGSSLVGI